MGKWLLEWTKVAAVQGRPVGELFWAIADAATFLLGRTLLRPVPRQAPGWGHSAGGASPKSHLPRPAPPRAAACCGGASGAPAAVGRDCEQREPPSLVLRVAVGTLLVLCSGAVVAAGALWRHRLPRPKATPAAAHRQEGAEPGRLQKRGAEA